MCVMNIAEYGRQNAYHREYFFVHDPVRIEVVAVNGANQQGE